MLKGVLNQAELDAKYGVHKENLLKFYNAMHSKPKDMETAQKLKDIFKREGLIQMAGDFIKDYSAIVKADLDAKKVKILADGQKKLDVLDRRQEELAVKEQAQRNLLVQLQAQKAAARQEAVGGIAAQFSGLRIKAKG